MEGRYLRIVYAVQFVVTLMAVLETWGQVGGQSHLDLIPWYGKLFLATGLAWAVVKATAAAVELDKFRNARTLRWLAAAFALIVTMGLLTYYEHLHEPGDDEQEQPAPVNIGRLRSLREGRTHSEAGPPAHGIAVGVLRRRQQMQSGGLGDGG